MIKKDSTNKLKQQTSVMSQEWALVTQSQGRVNELEAQTKEDKDEVAV